jgi:hypothetical protein
MIGCALRFTPEASHIFQCVCWSMTSFMVSWQLRGFWDRRAERRRQAENDPARP